MKLGARTLRIQYQYLVSHYHTNKLRHAIMELMTNHPVVAIAIAAWILTVLGSVFGPSRSKLPKLPWIGKSGDWPGAEYLASWGAIGSMRSWFSQGYKKV